MRGWAWQVVTDPVTMVTAVLLTGLVAATARPLARRLGWPVWATLGLLLAAAAMAVLTLVPAPGHPITGPSQAGWEGCLQSLTSRHDLWTDGVLATGSRGERVGNIAMFVPLTFFGVLATRRPLPVALAGVLLPVAVEMTQALTGGGRTCTGFDWVNNATGALIGVLLGVVALRLARRRAGRRAASPPGRPTG